ncbi:DEAD/DEAH box helicase family protein [Alkalimarinus sediminis]|uniref:DEAD/DEAH box helicase family protein n=1 Tax=Alkalimarinus sediminis TaxID=1632866 RepID=A0A9E8KRU6_9ALTE|nr:DEAD/DEAH box helicase family protein [Alkalimarinus sediminis]UZW76582.1 DEAD/DEAH box helicase family protein [Alkalimarinus sediminis]
MPFDTLTFRYSWRPYQQRVLDAIDDHLDDKRLHIVAAPGAGKTTLGLEVFKRLKKSALVLSPTRVIRDQWIDRLSDFCDGKEVSNLSWVSKSIHEPKILTSITYQALHSQLSDELAAIEDEVEALELDEGVTETELSSFVATLKSNNINVIILDEAHHLRAEWWRALDKVCTALPEIVLVSLTATPPYDAEGHEWSRYEQLCGPIDEEISIPELVKAGTLCGHQDYIWAVDVSTTEKQKVKEYDDRVSTVCNTLFESKEFEEIIFAHPWLCVDFTEQEVIRAPEIAIAILSFIKAKNGQLPQGLCITLDLTESDIPELGRHWWQVLVETVLFSKTFKHSDAHKESVDQLKKQLRASELLYNRELSLERSRRLGRSLSQSVSKVDACISLHSLEYEQRGDMLRQVILTDYIRDEALVSGIDTGEVSLGAWPIFKGVTSSSTISSQIALLTGRLSIIHSSLLNKLLALVDSGKFKAEPMGNQGQYQKVTGPLNQLTTAFTHLLMVGQIKTLVGTRSLLGEGWDAPAINSLVLASSVGSFMLTNQMRGRAIRIDKNNPDKVSSIWHLVAIDRKSPYSGWSDLYDLRNRFETFVGLSEMEPKIESGFERMNAASFREVNGVMPGDPVPSNNSLMRSRFRKITTLGHRWKEAFTLDESARVVPSVETPTIPSIRHYHIKHTLKYLLMQLGAFIGFAATSILHFQPQNTSVLLFLLSFAFLGIMIYKLPQTIKAVRILTKHLPVEGSLKQIGVALAESLCQAGLIETSIRRMKVNVLAGYDGSFYVSLTGSTFYESSLFSGCLAEILAPIENPRYLVVREGEMFGKKRDDYHAVPLKLAVKKELAQIFFKSWCKYVGPSELIYTRSPEGRKRLVKARMKAFSSTFRRDVKRQDRWQ